MPVVSVETSNRSGAQPFHETEMNGAAPQVHERADRFHHGTCHQIGRHGRERQHVEEQHEHRRHQGAAAHAGEADDNADSEGGDCQRQIEAHASGRRMREDMGDIVVNCRGN